MGASHWSGGSGFPVLNNFGKKGKCEFYFIFQLSHLEQTAKKVLFS